jgi:hypothetical protein
MLGVMMPGFPLLFLVLGLSHGGPLAALVLLCLCLLLPFRVPISVFAKLAGEEIDHGAVAHFAFGCGKMK